MKMTFTAEIEVEAVHIDGKRISRDDLADQLGTELHDCSATCETQSLNIFGIGVRPIARYRIRIAKIMMPDPCNRTGFNSGRPS